MQGLCERKIRVVALLTMLLLSPSGLLMCLSFCSVQVFSPTVKGSVIPSFQRTYSNR